MQSTRSLANEWASLLKEKPKMRIKNAADELGVSEWELLTSKCPDENTIILDLNMTEMLSQISSFGDVMALTRNEEVVHERKGIYNNFSMPSPHVGLFVNDEIDLRLFPASWKYAAAVAVESRGKVRKSVQFFSSWGQAIHKIYLTENSNEEAYDSFVEQFRSEHQGPCLIQDLNAPTESRKEVSEESIESFKAGWVALKDTHDFFGLMKKHGLTRLQALECAPVAKDQTFGSYAIQIDPQDVCRVIEDAAAQDVAIMVFVGNQGMIQIHTGEVKNIIKMDEWFNVMDKRFNLHLKNTDIYQSWLVFKPTEDGIVSSVEVFNEKEELIVQLFGKRKPGIPEATNWRQLLKKYY